MLDPVWAACQDVGLPISQHGGAGAPAYSPPGFASIMTLAIEHSFFSGRSLWQMIVGGVFDRFPDLQMVFVETEAYWMRAGDQRASSSSSGMGNDWMGFARSMNRDADHEPLAAEYWATNCHAGLSPFNSTMTPIEDFARDDGPVEFPAEFFISADKAMFGVDYPHFESILPSATATARRARHASRDHRRVARKILYDNAAEIYGFDLDVLQPHFERVGFEPGEVLATAAT